MGINFITSQIRKLELAKVPLEKQLATTKDKLANIVTEHQTKIELLENQLKSVNEMIDRYKGQQPEQNETCEPETILTSTINAGPSFITTGL